MTHAKSSSVMTMYNLVGITSYIMNTIPQNTLKTSGEKVIQNISLATTRSTNPIPGDHLPLRYPEHYSEEDCECRFVTNRAIDHISSNNENGWGLNINYIKPHPPNICSAPLQRHVRSCRYASNQTTRRKIAIGASIPFTHSSKPQTHIRPRPA